MKSICDYNEEGDEVKVIGLLSILVLSEAIIISVNLRCIKM